ncbi:MAG: hypothetical protein ABI366_09230 [Ginsengibacter sp.]
MKKYLILSAIAITFLVTSARSQEVKTPYLTKSFSSANISIVISQTAGGNISVTAVTGSESRVEVYVSQNGKWKNKLSDDEIKSKIAEGYDLVVSVNNGTLIASAKPKHSITNWKNSLSFSFKIYAPQKVSTQLKTSGGNIGLTGLYGDQEFKTSGGNLSLNSLSGNIKGKTSGGNISINNCKNDLTVSTSGGNIFAENSEGHIIVSTSGGSVQLNGLKGNIEASTSGGNVKGENIEGTLSARTSGGNVSLQKLSCSVKASTSGGNIDVTVLHPGKYISLNNSAGQVRLVVPKNIGMDLRLNASKISTQNLINFSGENSTNEINGTVNGGGIPVTIDAGSGRIVLEFE